MKLTLERQKEIQELFDTRRLHSGGIDAHYERVGELLAGLDAIRAELSDYKQSPAVEKLYKVMRENVKLEDRIEKFRAALKIVSYGNLTPLGISSEVDKLLAMETLAADE